MFRKLFHVTSLMLFALGAQAAEPVTVTPAVDAAEAAETAVAEPKNPPADAFPEQAVEARVPEAAEPEPAGTWSGSGELGATMTTGNSETRSFNGKLEVQYEEGRWRHGSKLEALKSSDDGADTAERYVAAYKADYKKTERTYIFGSLRGEVDKFSGYDYRLSESVGYGRRFWEVQDKGYFDLEAGPGARQSRLEDGTHQRDTILRVAAKYRNKWTETTEFSEDLIVEAGEDNTFTESVTGFKLKINSHLAMKLSVTVKHNSDVPPDKENTDTISAITLVFDF